MSGDPADAESPLLPSPNDEGESSAAAASAGKDASSAIESAATKMAQTTYWLLSNIGASGFLGICAGVATKTIGRWLALLIGLVFVLMQVLAYYGVVTVHWEDMRKKAMSVLDANKDGRVDYEDAKLVWKKAFSLMGQGLPSVAGFLGGFFLGLKFF